MDKVMIERGLFELQKHGFSAVGAGDHIIVKEPQHKCDTGTDAGRLILTGYVDCPLRSGNAVTKFLYDRV
ncbi:MAG TPA: hypothetical protein VF450_17440 [Noviherbaspirillum sp.]